MKRGTLFLLGNLSGIGQGAIILALEEVGIGLVGRFLLGSLFYIVAYVTTMAADAYLTRSESDE